ncbi:uncharacterized protein GGS22DRAFT_196047 [Annulohypoxylon maeteangense]|uniref:uncharacterized protein n=1 Tax=Annulohypoxylon maeteangense TaxID=1927788 RepID=UPI0020083256|nr:uncharacterized protein GGS22DRAFT_196047 [Annulohypoxylon maeteangense]KAI0882358.1 hypothetical protein GGS22DRAFT_196047 [Annulohypoxylon maeteangense]
MDRQNSTATTLTQETPPPPYTQYLDEEDVEREAEDVEEISSQSSKGLDQPHPPIQPAIHTTSAFPTSWGLYRLLSMSRLLMVVCRERGPLFAVSRNPGWWHKLPELVLHRGPCRELPALAAGMGGVGVGRHSTIVLPPLPGSGLKSSQEILRRVEAQDQAEEGQPESHVRFQFTIEVGIQPDQWKRETFEWRYDEGEFIAVFLEGATSGWKLVRLADEEESSDYEGPEPGPRQEIVAVWAYTRMSLTKVLKFRCLGTGASGVFGERWTIMAAMTALRMYQRQQKNRHKDW